MPTLPAARRNEVLSAAADCFARFGYAKTNMQLLADAAGMSRPGLYQYFANKSAVFSAVTQRNLDLLRSEIRSISDAPGSVVGKLVSILEVVMSMYQAPTPGTFFHADLINEVFARAWGVWVDFQTDVLHQLANVLANAIPGEADSARMQSGAAVLFAGAKGLGVDATGPGAPLITLAELVEIVLSGVTHSESS